MKLILFSSRIFAKFTFSDNNIEYYKLKKHVPNVKFAFVQNGLRDSRYDIFEQFKNYPRFLSAIKIRIEKYNQRQTKDKDLFRDINRLQTKWIEKVSEFVESDCKIPQTYIDFQWAMQELRVSLFAQELKTPYPISIKRLEKNWTDLVNK